ncbi:RNA-guided endonuclease InsQ/TnpB family protein [Pectinatus frisingensis]|uniref:RNA-guided endonuclease InsQ/TnpB family protein n=1 Tax=Pectinatus frisingensis TaxID=865 RepID=UPI0018C4C4BB|nr:RNA-guided endonuclease TnpB family protein [Pectinatus frisingensis]
METVITAKVKLLPTPEQIPMLDNTLAAVRAGLNYASRIAHENNLLSTFKKLQKLTYTDLRSKYGLKSQMACNVCSVVAGTYASMKSNKENTIAVYQKPKLQYSYNRDYSFSKDGQISINTTDKRIKIPFIAKAMEQYFDGTWEYGTATLVKKKGKYFLHIAVKKDIETCKEQEVTNIVGIDVGMNFIATAIDSSDKMLFIGGRHMKNTKAEYKRTRKSLQLRQTSSARRRLKKIGDRENRWQQDLNHKAAKALVTFAGKNSLIVIEDLTGIRSATEKVIRKNRSYSVSWAFLDLRNKIEYKAKLAGIQTIAVDPKYTSQKCPICGHTEKTNRDKKKHRFCCKSCGYQSNDDRIGAINLRQKGIEYRHAVSSQV